MKIWFVNHYAVPLTHVGNVRHFTLARELVKRGHDVSIVASSFIHKTLSEGVSTGKNACKHENIEGVDFLWIKTPPYKGNSWKRLWNMTVFGFRFWMGKGTRGLKRPDIIIGSSPDPLAAFAAYRVARRLKVPFVFEVRDLWPQTLVDLGRISPNHPLVRIF